MAKHLYVADSGCGFLDADLKGLTERHRIELQMPPLARDLEPLKASQTPEVAGVIIEIPRGCALGSQLQLATRLNSQKTPAFFYWPVEGAVERMDAGRIRSHANVGRVVNLWSRWKGTPHLR